MKLYIYFLIFLISINTLAKNLQIGISEFPPLASKKVANGGMVQLYMNPIFDELKLKSNYQFIPYARLVPELITGRLDFTFFGYIQRTEDFDKFKLQVLDIGTVELCYYYQVGKFKENHLFTHEEFKKLRFVTIFKDTLAPYHRSLGYKVDEVDSVMNIHKMIDSGRADIVHGVRLIADVFLKKNGHLFKKKFVCSKNRLNMNLALLFREDSPYYDKIKNILKDKTKFDLMKDKLLKAFLQQMSH